MRFKSELYAKEQRQIIGQIIDILGLDKYNSVTLYDLDNHPDKTNQIMNLIPKIRTFFNFSDIKGASEPHTIKRPWLSIIRQLTKGEYEMVSCDYRMKIDGKTIRTKRYYFHKKIKD